MFKKLSDKFSKGIIYLAAFLVTALMAVMMIHIVKESIPAISQLGIKMFLNGALSVRNRSTDFYLRLPVPFMSQRSQLSSHSSSALPVPAFWTITFRKRWHPYSLRSSIWLQESRPSSSDLSDLRFL